MEEWVKYFFELSHLKNIKHEGWRLAGVPFPDSVAEHTTGAAQIAYILAHMEGHPEPERIATMVLFHDVAETRIGDIHKLGIRYAKRNEAQVVKEQTESLGEVGKKIREMWEEFEARETKAAQIAKDADRLEQAVMARKYILQGYKDAQDWINNIRISLFTKSALKLLDIIENADPNAWWKGKKLVGKKY